MEWPDIRCEKDLESAGSEFLRYSIPLSPAVLTMRGILLPVPPRARTSEWSDDSDQPELRLCVSVEATEYGGVDQFAGVLDPQRGWIMLRPVGHPTGKKLTNIFFQLIGEEAARIRRRFEEVIEMIQDNLAEYRRQRVLGMVPATGEIPVEPVFPPNQKMYSAAAELETQPGNTTPSERLTPPRSKTRTRSKNQSIPNQPELESPAQPEPVTTDPESKPDVDDSEVISTAAPSTVKASEKKKPKTKAPSSTGQMSLFDL
ncbi:MAG TPA: hypothetical protein PLB32_13085 [Acidobacteriota bacterium]|nr:hypothetical protein [Acidobacteriota bacterium]